MKRLYCSLLTLVLILAISSSNVLAYGNTKDLMIGSTGVNEKSTFNKNKLDKEKKLAIAADITDSINSADTLENRIKYDLMN